MVRRDQPVRFTFDGRTYEGYEGDTLASALLANGVHLVGRSFKYHRPRGILSAGVEEPNAIVTIDRGPDRVTPNLRATAVELYDGLVARSQNAWPSIRFDLGAIAGVASPLLSAGFYYKTFKWPAAFWRGLYEPAIRAAAGLGRAPGAPDPDRYLHRYAHCEVLVIGGGPAGLAAASATVARGERVILCDEQATLGGSLLSRTGTYIDHMPISDWIATTGQSIPTVLTRTTAFGWYPDNMIGLVERVTDHLARPNPNLPRERLWLVRANRVVIATGAIERPLVFPGNDRPGIMLAGAAAVYLHRYGVLPGTRIVVATSHDSAWHIALALARAGAIIVAICDRRTEVATSLREAARDAGIAVRLGARIARAGGWRRVRYVQAGRERFHCDTVLMSDGWTPSVHLFSQSRGKLRFDPVTGTFLPGESAATERSVGACAGTFGLVDCLAAGHRAGGGSARTFHVDHEPACGAGAPPTPGTPHGRAFVDFQNDVTSKDLAIAVAEGFHAIEHVKRYTTTGMATDQGKTANLNALATVAALTDRTMPETGLTTFRPPYTPVTFGSLAGAARGDLFTPVRRTPINDRDAVFEDVGDWQRARYFPLSGETMHQAVAREGRAVRDDLGMLDASTLGKIEVVGPDAAAFLNLMYTGDFTRLAIGRCKYGVLLGEDGFVRDDGVIGRLAADRFHVTTTTGGAATVLHHMEDYRQTEFTNLRVWLTSITEQWAVIALQGPRAAEALAPLLNGIDLETMPHMSVREGRFAGVPTRLFRVSFTGELGYEINVPAEFGRAAWDRLRGCDAVRYGTEAMHVLRAEKGFIIIGQETDGTVTPDDLGLAWTIARSKPDFVGKRSLARTDMTRSDRLRLVGLLTDDPGAVPEEGTQITDDGERSIGHVTSAYNSTVLGRSIALALMVDGGSRIGTKTRIAGARGEIWVTVTQPTFHDPGGERMFAPALNPVTRRTDLAGSSFTADSPHQASPPQRGGTGTRYAGSALLSAPWEAERLGEAGDNQPLRPIPVSLTAALSGSAAEMTLMPEIGRFCVRSGVLLAPPLRACAQPWGTALWLGPDEYLVLATEPPPIAADSIVDVSNRTVAFRLASARAASCINAFCPLDLDAAPEGFCARTVFGKAEIILWRVGAETFHLEVARSFAPYVWDCLGEAHREFAPPEAAW
jgi:sarcosine oxidase subunit alpha